MKCALEETRVRRFWHIEYYLAFFLSEYSTSGRNVHWYWKHERYWMSLYKKISGHICELINLNLTLISSMLVYVANVKDTDKYFGILVDWQIVKDICFDKYLRIFLVIFELLWEARGARGVFKHADSTLHLNRKCLFWWSGGIARTSSMRKTTRWGCT